MVSVVWGAYGVGVGTTLTGACIGAPVEGEWQMLVLSSRIVPVVFHPHPSQAGAHELCLLL